MSAAARTVFITGASRGLGRTIAQAFGAQGAFVYIGYRSRARDAGETLRLVREAGGDGVPLEADVRDRRAVDDAVARIIAERGAIDVLVNNAGIAQDELFPLMAEQSWEDVLAVNLSGVFHCCRAVVRAMIGRQKGAIVNIASVAGIHPSPGQANYAASKGGVLALTRALAAELAPRGVRVNAVVPGLLEAGIAARLDPRIAEKKRGQIPLGRFGTPEEVAKAVVFLASEDAAYIVGQALVIDGGLSL